ncbi:hypothetical protein RHSIM_RhsimUnG0007300 [Rhododendron simsii]|uniref:Uncharacterized protein n=1 Tax=Rhododendron simsii TaxID=118357 RepID=A0A834FXX8_RHOSS|nr:hypothetical protein RHSIM_RhsimUnG0007300 [Rhododendron simsii]
MDPTESWDGKSMDSRNGFANVSTQNGVKEDDGELSGSMYVLTTDTLGTTSKRLNSQQLLQDNGQSKGINLMVDLNISQGRIERLSELLERGEMEVQSKNSSLEGIRSSLVRENRLLRLVGPFENLFGSL